MAGLRGSQSRRLTLALFVLLGLCSGLQARNATDGEDRGSLHDRPVLAVDPGMHTAPIISAAVDEAGRFLVTGSHDKTVRIWSLADGKLLQTIRVPTGPGNIGKIYTVAMSPDGEVVAAGGWTYRGKPDAIYLFDSSSGTMSRRITVTMNTIPSRSHRTASISRPVSGKAACASMSEARLGRKFFETRTTIAQFTELLSQPTGDWPPPA